MTDLEPFSYIAYDIQRGGFLPESENPYSSHIVEKHPWEQPQDKDVLFWSTIDRQYMPYKLGDTVEETIQISLAPLLTTEPTVNSILAYSKTLGCYCPALIVLTPVGGHQIIRISAANYIRLGENGSGPMEYSEYQSDIQNVIHVNNFDPLKPLKIKYYSGTLGFTNGSVNYYNFMYGTLVPLMSAFVSFGWGRKDILDTGTNYYLPLVPSANIVRPNGQMKTINSVLCGVGTGAAYKTSPPAWSTSSEAISFSNLAGEVEYSIPQQDTGVDDVYFFYQGLVNDSTVNVDNALRVTYNSNYTKFDDYIELEVWQE